MQAIGLAIHDWHDGHDQLPSPVTVEPDSAPVTWRITLLPWLADNDPSPLAALATGYDPKLEWDKSANLPIALRAPEPYVCLTNPVPIDDQQRYFTAYALVTGDGTPFPESGPLSLSEIEDGTSETLLIGEACGRRIIWTEPRDVDVAQEQPDINGPGDELDASASLLSSYHTGGCYVTLADGSVRFLNQSIDASVLRALVTANGDDDAGDF
jgi:hypothetical protein